MYNHDIYKLTLYKTSNFMAINKYILIQHVINVHNIKKATVYRLLK